VKRALEEFKSEIDSIRASKDCVSIKDIHPTCDSLFREELKHFNKKKFYNTGI
jgi:hypothetical protein